MGLGPPVCERCRTYAEFLQIPVTVDVLEPSGKIWKRHSYYKCKYCGNADPQWNAWSCGLTEKELDENELFLDFVTGKNDKHES